MRPRAGASATLKSAVLMEDAAVGVELRGSGMGLNKHEKPGRGVLPGGVGMSGYAQWNCQAEGRNAGVGLNAPLVVLTANGVGDEECCRPAVKRKLRPEVSIHLQVCHDDCGRAGQVAGCRGLGHPVGNALLHAGPAASIQRAKGAQAAGMSPEAHATRDGLHGSWWRGER